MTTTSSAKRQTVFISKATPGDDDFALWLAPRLEAHGYRVFADILSLDAGDRWRQKLTSTLQNNAVKMLLCCSDASLARDGVDEELAIATDLTKQLPDPNFIIPLRLRAFKKVFGIGGLQYLDFEQGWANGLTRLLDSLERQNVPKANPDLAISPEWERYQKRAQVVLEDAPERLTSNWVRVTAAPDHIHWLTPTGPINHSVMLKEANTFAFPLAAHNRGFFGFCSPDELTEHFVGTGKFAVGQSILLAEFLEAGAPDMDVDARTAHNHFVSIMRTAWERYCRQLGLLRYEYASGPSFHIGEDQAKLRQRIAWGRQGDKRSSVLRNIAKNKVWEFGMSAIPSLYPFPHYRLKARVLFSDVKNENGRGDTIDDSRVQHRLRRSVCLPWRNPAWHGRLMAYLELLAPDLAEILLPVSAGQVLRVDATPITLTSPVSVKQTDAGLDEDAEETDETTLPPSRGDEEDE